MIGGIDAGGTQFKCGVASPEGDLLARADVPTTDPDRTVAACTAFFTQTAARLGTPLTRLGLASFGPLELDPASPHFGCFLTTPKPGWSGFALHAAFAAALKLPVTLETDVNAALLAERQSGAAEGVASAAYITVGTGIGAGIWARGGLLGQPSHPEFGHIAVQRHPLDKDFPGLCPFHSDCLEGLASAAAFTARFGDPRSVPEDHPGWRIEADYLAQACLSLIYSARVERILLGGGLMQAPLLIEHVRRAILRRNADYLALTEVDLATQIVLPKHGKDAGLIGALSLVRRGGLV